MMTSIATIFGVGRIPIAPGTIASFFSAGVAGLLHFFGGTYLLSAATFLVFVVGWLSVSRYLKHSTEKDPSEVVVDEVAGQMLALIPLSAFLQIKVGTELPVGFAVPLWVAGFVLFRLFDILKPWIVGKAEERDGALGVMLDDIVAGAFAGLIVGLAAIVANLAMPSMIALP